jgi:acetolactate synthase-1/2/3 large subunit
MGMVRQWQELIHGGRYSNSYTAALPDFVKLAEAFGGVGLRADRPDQLDGVIEAMLKVEDRPCIVDVRVDPKENCFPMIPGGKAHNEMIFGPESNPAAATPEDGMVLV